MTSRGVDNPCPSPRPSPGPRVSSLVGINTDIWVASIAVGCMAPLPLPLPLGAFISSMIMDIADCMSK